MKRTGATTAGIEESPRRRRRRARQRKREEELWASLSGPVKVYVDESVRRARQSSAVDA